MDRFAPGAQISLYPVVTDTTGSIGQDGVTRVTLQPGYYLVSYNVSVLFRAANYLQISPAYNGGPHLENGIYFATTANGSSAGGSVHFILYAPSATVFTLTYSSPAEGLEGQVNITFFKLRRSG